MQTKTIRYNGRPELYVIVDGYLEMFVGHLHTCDSPADVAQDNGRGYLPHSAIRAIETFARAC